MSNYSNQYVNDNRSRFNCPTNNYQARPIIDKYNNHAATIKNEQQFQTHNQPAVHLLPNNTFAQNMVTTNKTLTSPTIIVPIKFTKLMTQAVVGQIFQALTYQDFL